MNIVALAVLLTVIQASPPVPRQAANPSNGTAQNVKEQPSADKPPSIVQPINTSPNQDGSHTPAAEDAQKPVVIGELPPVSVSKDRWDRIYICLTGILIVVGTCGVRAAYKTLGEMKAQRVAMQGQLTAMQGQLSQMKNAGEQTERLIAEAKAQAEKTDIAAEAAQKTANALMDVERAWVLIEKVELVTKLDGGPESPRAVTFRIKGRNYGRSPAIVAHIDGTMDLREKRDASDSPLSETPYKTTSQRDRARIVPPRRQFWYECDQVLLIEAVDKKKVWGDAVPPKFLFAHGIIHYTDAFGRDWFTRFSYRFDNTRFAPMNQSGFYFPAGPSGFNAWT